MRENNLNQTQLAKKADFPIGTVNGWLNKNRLPDYNSIVKLARYFEISPAYLLGMTDERETYTEPVILTKREKSLLAFYRDLDEKQQSAFDSILETLRSLTKS